MAQWAGDRRLPQLIPYSVGGASAHRSQACLQLSLSGLDVVDPPTCTCSWPPDLRRRDSLR
ncbi:hypothetical protein I553_7708 [Mycobacterium xenopi 4042]|uniref:Uncharacterized protein n=1 Tax=Mycobacterium xenopi 4042 TaxID=1299334 RepID=X8AQL3_MYCXE|nr:hypothetical protein I553_7708 [Mycobacterium xenopi 4042]